MPLRRAPIYQKRAVPPHLFTPARYGARNRNARSDLFTRRSARFPRSLRKGSAWSAVMRSGFGRAAGMTAAKGESFATVGRRSAFFARYPARSPMLRRTFKLDAIPGCSFLPSRLSSTAVCSHGRDTSSPDEIGANVPTARPSLQYRRVRIYRCHRHQFLYPRKPRPIVGILIRAFVVGSQAFRVHFYWCRIGIRGPPIPLP